MNLLRRIRRSDTAARMISSYLSFLALTAMFLIAVGLTRGWGWGWL